MRVMMLACILIYIYMAVAEQGLFDASNLESDPKVKFKRDACMVVHDNQLAFALLKVPSIVSSKNGVRDRGGAHL